jgi:hypothetical protein
MITYYFSKWRIEWIKFKNQPPSKGELLAMEKYNYSIKIEKN